MHWVYAMTPERLAEIRGRLEAATPGPWDVKRPGEPAAGGFGIVANLGNDCDFQRCFVTAPHVASCRRTKADAALIAHAPQDIADLMKEVESLQEQRDRLAAGAVAMTEGLNTEVERLQSRILDLDIDGDVHRERMQRAREGWATATDRAERAEAEVERLREGIAEAAYVAEQLQKYMEGHRSFTVNRRELLNAWLDKWRPTDEA